MRRKHGRDRWLNSMGVLCIREGGWMWRVRDRICEIGDVVDGGLEGRALRDILDIDLKRFDVLWKFVL